MVVVGNEKLTIEMQKMFTKNGVTVISAPKSGGVSPLSTRVIHVLTRSLEVVELDEQYRNRIKSQQTKTYFYGEPPLPSSLTELPGRTVAMEANLHPHSFTVSWDDLEIYRIGEGRLECALRRDDALTSSWCRNRRAEFRITDGLDASVIRHSTDKG